MKHILVVFVMFTLGFALGTSITLCHTEGRSIVPITISSEAAADHIAHGDIPINSARDCLWFDSQCEISSAHGKPCLSGSPGICSPGIIQCLMNEHAICVSDSNPTAEVCDGLDNDCNGAIDDGNPQGGASCTTQLLGRCSTGTVTCVNGTLQCVANLSPIAELCNGIDDDCDGVVDEGNPGSGSGCNTGLLGVCSTGLTYCHASGELRCAQNVTLSAETCDGIDNNCDGVIDNEIAAIGQSCNTGLLGVCATGTYTSCAGASGLVCTATASASTETCDGLDNDCDGAVDEGVCSCSVHPQWTPVACTQSLWVYSSNRAYTTTTAASAAHTLFTSREGGGLLCSLTGTGWISTASTTITNCDTQWWHIGSFNGNCGGHSGEETRRLAMANADCYSY